MIDEDSEPSPKLESKMLQMIKDLIGDGFVPNCMEKWFLSRVSMELFFLSKLQIMDEIVALKLDEMKMRYIEFKYMFKQKWFEWDHKTNRVRILLIERIVGEVQAG